MSQITSPKGGKDEFLPSDIWAKNVVGLDGESKRQSESQVALIAFAVLALAFVAGAFQWIVPSVQGYTTPDHYALTSAAADADKLLMDQIAGLQQRNALLEVWNPPAHPAAESSRGRRSYGGQARFTRGTSTIGG